MTRTYSVAQGTILSILSFLYWRMEWQTTSAFLPWEIHEHYEKAKIYDTERWTPRSLGVQYATGEEQRNSSRRNEEAGPKQKQRPVVDVSGGENRLWCCKEQYCIGTWSVRSMNQGKLDAVKQEMARVNINHLRNQWTKMDWNGRI